MTKNEMTTEGMILKKTILDGENELTYIMSKNISTAIASFKITLYSIKIEMKNSDGNFSFYELNNVFANEVKARCFFDKLVSNLATPINLPFVFDDEMS